MGSSMDSRYWVCPTCCKQFDWEKEPDVIKNHDPSTCSKRKEKSPISPVDEK